jgi:hypothetical protein
MPSTGRVFLSARACEDDLYENNLDTHNDGITRGLSVAYSIKDHLKWLTSVSEIQECNSALT